MCLLSGGDFASVDLIQSHLQTVAYNRVNLCIYSMTPKIWIFVNFFVIEQYTHDDTWTLLVFLWNWTFEPDWLIPDGDSEACQQKAGAAWLNTLGSNLQHGETSAHQSTHPDILHPHGTSQRRRDQHFGLFLPVAYLKNRFHFPCKLAKKKAEGILLLYFLHLNNVLVTTHTRGYLHERS